MHQKFPKKWLTIFCLLFTQLSFAGGGWSGNGGGSASTYDFNNMWFLGAEPVPYCMIVGKGSFPSRDALHMMIKQSAQKWGEFFNRYDLKKGISEISKEQFPDKLERSLSLQFTPSSDCTDVEKFCSPEQTNPDACHQALSQKVLFLFGKPNTVVENFLKMNAKTDGASIRTDYNHKTYRSGGIVWINQLKVTGWSQYFHMILHEMGHVFGMKHDSCWVMAKDVTDFLNGWTGLGGLGQIEAPNWPYSFKKEDHLIFTDQRSQGANSKPGYYPNKYFLAGLWDKFGFSENDSFRLSGSILYASKSSLKLSISFEEEASGKTISMEGDLTEKYNNNDFSYVPSLYTSWINRFVPTVTEMKTVYLSNQWSSDNLQGSLAWENQTVPVTLERKRGLVLSLFFAQTNRWLTLSTVQWNQNSLNKK